MTTKKKASTGKKLKLKKETLKNLAVDREARNVKGGKGTGAQTVDCLAGCLGSKPNM
jgi:hypothetical protein